MSKITEDQIRDYLAKKLEIIESDLTLVKKEEYFPNDNGASGFVDIFARANNGKLVIIEIKKSDAAARQAIQELSKYAALLKSNRLVRETEYRLLVLSTAWHELLTPFSEFVHATNYECQGRKIVVGPDGYPVRTEIVQPLPPARTRHFSRRHFILEFKTETIARKAIEPLATHMREAGLTDFIAALITLPGPIDDISHLVYFAQQELTLGEYMTLIKTRFTKDDVEEFLQWIDDMPELEDKVGEAADKVWNPESGESLYSRTNSDGCQIAHPEKAAYWLNPTQAKSIEIFRFGRFADELLSDETIIKELVGDSGSSNYRVDVVANIQSKPEIEAFFAAADNLFYYNSIWKGSVRDLCEYAQKTRATQISLRAFNNDDVLAAISGLSIGRASYVSSFILEIVGPDRHERFHGVIEWDGRKPSFDKMLKEYFDGDTFSYFMHRHFGEQRNLNAELMADLGLSYVLWKGDGKNSSKVRIQGSSVIELRRSTSKTLLDFPQENPDFVGGVFNMFIAHDSEFNQHVRSRLEEFKTAEIELETTKPSRGKASYWLGQLDGCDICGRPFADTNFMVDANLQKGGAACVCALCFKRHGIGLGWGKGQLYKKRGSRWKLVAGGRGAE